VKVLVGDVYTDVDVISLVAWGAVLSYWPMAAARGGELSVCVASLSKAALGHVRMTRGRGHWSAACTGAETTSKATCLTALSGEERKVERGDDDDDDTTQDKGEKREEGNDALLRLSRRDSLVAPRWSRRDVMCW
jgi:hypothetical protein